MTEISIVDVDKENIGSSPPRCFLKPDNPGQMQKNQWTVDRFDEGLRIKLLYIDGKLAGYIEYIPGKYAWRAVDAKEYLFIHCIWMYPNKNKKKGYGSRLIEECIKDAEANGFCGVAVVASDEAFMAGKDVFEKNGFEIVLEEKPYQLMVKRLTQCPLPSFFDYTKELEKYQGLHIVYSKQCPWVNRFMDEMVDKLQKHDVKVTVLNTAKEAQHGPSVYGTFSLIYNGRLLVDHYISERRFDNIIKKEVK